MLLPMLFFVFKHYYYEMFYQIFLVIILTKILVLIKKEEIWTNQSFVSSMNNPINEGYDDIPILYRISKLHMNPYRERYIVSTSTCSIKKKTCLLL